MSAALRPIKSVHAAGTWWISHRGVVTAVVAVGVLVLAALVGSRGVFMEPRLTVAASLILLLGTVAIFRPRAIIPVLLALLAVSGDLRRLLSLWTGYPAIDPMHLVVPAVALIALAQSTRWQKLQWDTPLSKLVTALGALFIAQAVNPLQGSLLTGLGGLFFYLPAVIWYWIGKTYGDEYFTDRLIRWLVLPVGVLSAAYGVYQAEVGVPRFQLEWVERVQYAALNVGGSIRPFGFFPSSSEFSTFARLAFVVAIVSIITKRGGVTGLLAIPAFVGVFIAGSRGSMVISAATIAFCLSIQGRRPWSWVPRLALTLAATAVAGRWALEQAQGLNVTGTTANILQHQTGGLLNPLDERHSTLLLHVDLVVRGFAQALSNPLGFGTGATTLAANRLGGAPQSTEVDISNIFVSLGLVGGLVFLAIIYFVFAQGTRLWIQRRDYLSLCLLALAFTQLGNWLNTGQYATVAVVWFGIGAIDRLWKEISSARTDRHA